MNNYSAFSISLIILITVMSGSALECYVCDKQEDNNGKCVQTIRTCEYGEDVCQTEISWGSTPYWEQGGALKQYYISKKCATKDSCAKYRRSNMPTCIHLWYQDWKCSECCRGDRCNYYIISGSTQLQQPKYFIITAVLFSFIYRLF